MRLKQAPVPVLKEGQGNCKGRSAREAAYELGLSQL
jgi:hypothetical protein